MSACRKCGASFDVPLRSGPKPQFCSAVCRRAHRKRYFRAWSADNKEKVARDTKERQKRFNDLHPDYWRRYYEANREHKKRVRREWFAANRERALVTAKAYAEANPELIRMLGRKSMQKRRAVMREAFVESVDPIVIFNRDGGICGICKQAVARDSDWHVDHVVPLAKGGEHSYANTQLAHGSCNRAKGARSPPQLGE